VAHELGDEAAWDASKRQGDAVVVAEGMWAGKTTPVRSARLRTNRSRAWGDKTLPSRRTNSGSVGLVSFGLTKNTATLAVIGWRLVNFWLPIPIGAASYLSLKVPRHSGLRAKGQALSNMTIDARRPSPLTPPATGQASDEGSDNKPSAPLQKDAG
jgi:hypothetical protein